MQPIIDWYHSHQIAAWSGAVFVALLVRYNWDRIAAISKTFFAKSPGAGNGAGGHAENSAATGERSSGETSPKTQLGFDSQRPQIVAIEFDMSNVEHVRIFHTTKELIAKCPDKAISLVQQSQVSQELAGGNPA